MNAITEVANDPSRAPRPTLPEVALTPAQKREWDYTRVRFQSVCPMFAHVLYTMMSWSGGRLAYFTDSPAIPIAATDGTRIIMRPDTYFQFDLDERVFILAHEVAHAILDHCTLGQRFSRAKEISYSDGKRLPYDHGTMNRALDYIINDMLVEAGTGKMPKVGLHDRNVARYTDEGVLIYRKLYEKDPPPQSGGQGSQLDVILEPGSLAEADEGASQGEGGAAGAGRMEAEWKTAVAAGMALEKSVRQGKLPGCLERTFGEFIEPRISWQEHIQALFARKVGAGGYDWRNPDGELLARPFVHAVTSESNAQAMIAPSRSGKGVGCVVVGVDTSGSIGDKEVAVFFSEMTGILEDLRPQRLVIMWCDAKVRRVDEVEDAADLAALRSKGAPGGGGTEFFPVFNEVERMGLTPDALVYFTDGYGGFPDRAPAYPTIWGTIGLDPAKYPFGDVVEVEL